MKKAKNQGITLIALIVTIIILLILAGTAISLLSGQNGILQRSQGAVSQYRISAARELLDLKLLEIDADSYETNLRKATFIEIVEKLRDDAGFIIVGIDLGEEPIFENNLVLPDDLNSLKAIFVCSTQYKDVIFKITNEREISIYGEKVDVEIPEPGEIGYQITYHKNDGSGEKQVQLLDKGVETSLELNQFTRGGYTLEGWYANAECTGEKITTVSDNIEVYAKWVAKTAIESGGPTTIGDTTYTDSFEIWNKPQLENFRNRVNGGETFENCVVRQKADINLNSENWIPIGNETNYFSGTYDGEEHTIDGLYINSSNNYQGLFGYVQNGTVENLTVYGSVTGGSGSAGIVGCMNGGVIDHVTNKVTVKHSGNYIQEYNQYCYIVGGICGQAKSQAIINNCINEGTVTGGSKLQVSDASNLLLLGGILGIAEEAQNVQINNCGNTGNIKIEELTQLTGIVYSAGITGCLLDAKIEKCYNTGNIESEQNIQYVTAYSVSGGIAGYADKRSNDTSISKCWNSGNVTNFGAAGICGLYLDIEVQYCYNKGIITSDYNCGGEKGYTPCAGGIIACCTDTKGQVKNCYNGGEIYSKGIRKDKTGNENFPGAGGIVGINIALIEKSYNIGKIEANVASDLAGCAVGGIEGVTKAGANMNNCYNIGELHGSGNYVVSGGIIGWQNETSKQGMHQYLYNMGKFNNTSTNAKIGGLVGYQTIYGTWSNFYWLDKSTTYVVGNGTGINGKLTSTQLKETVSNGSLPDTDWVTNPEINDGYPYLKAFDDTSIWLRDSKINDGEPYLKDNPPVK